MKIKEWFTANGKKILNYIIAFIIGFLVASTVILNISNRRINRADIEIATLGLQLSAAREEVERAGTTISNIRKLQSDLTEGLGSNNTELHSVIERLQLIAEKVRHIEDELNDYYADSGSRTDIHDN